MNPARRHSRKVQAEAAGQTTLEDSMKGHRKVIEGVIEKPLIQRRVYEYINKQYHKGHRYLFVFGYMYRKIVQTLETKAFDPFDRNLPYRYRMRQIGYTIGTMFVRSYEQGERVYMSMLCRGYGKHSHLFLKKKGISSTEWAFLVVSLGFIVIIPVWVWFSKYSIYQTLI